MEDYKKISKELQERLVQTCIDYFKEYPCAEVDEIRFLFDNIQDSIKEGSWDAASDSFISIWAWNLENPDKFSRDKLGSYC